MNTKTRLVLALVTALVGLGLATRALYRSGPTAVPAAGMTAAEEKAHGFLEAYTPRLSRVNDRSAPRVLAEIRERVKHAASALATTRPVLTTAQADDLADAVSFRLAPRFGGTFDDNLRDLEERGWKIPDAETLAQRRSVWDTIYRQQPMPPIVADEIGLRELDPAALDHPGGLQREGFRLTELSYDPAVAPVNLGRDDRRFIEVTVPMRVRDTDGAEHTGLLGVVFVWDGAIERWRPIRKLIFSADPDAGGIPIRPFI